MAIEYGANYLHKLTIVIDNIDYSNQVKYVKFVYGPHAKKKIGLICLNNGLLYYFDKPSRPAIEYTQVSSNVRLANILYEVGKIYWVDYNENLNILDMYTLTHEPKNIVANTAVHPTASPIIKLLQGHEKYYYKGHTSFYYTMFILDQGGALYVHGDNPNLNIIKKVHTRVEEPQVILTNILDFYIHPGDSPLYVLVY